MSVARTSRQIPTITGLFRERSLATLVTDVIPLAAAQNKGSVEIAQVGPSNGAETYGVIASLAALGIQATVRGYEIHTTRLAEARRARYDISGWGVAYSVVKHGFPLGSLAFFEEEQIGAKEFVRPRADILPRASFQYANALVDPLPNAMSDVAMAWNVLYHFYQEPEDQDKLFANMLRNVRPGGIVAFDAHRLLTNWTARLPEEFPVKPVEDVNPSEIAAFWKEA